MSKKTAQKAAASTIALNQVGANCEYIDHVKTSFDGLRKVVGKLPEGKEKTTIMEWVGDTYLAATKTILSLAGDFAPVNANA